jgi:hypothetical protein
VPPRATRPSAEQIAGRPHIPERYLVLKGMNTNFRRTLLAVTAALGLFVGVWAYAFPSAFYSSFPGLGLHWIDVSGPYDEHLIRDVGGLYLGLSAITVWATFSRIAQPGRLAGLGWTVFGLLHFIFHLTHPVGGKIDVAGDDISLLLVLALGVVLLLPGRAGKRGEVRA